MVMKKELLKNWSNFVKRQYSVGSLVSIVTTSGSSGPSVILSESRFSLIHQSTSLSKLRTSGLFNNRHCCYRMIRLGVLPVSRVTCRRKRLQTTFRPRRGSGGMIPKTDSEQGTME